MRSFLRFALFCAAAASCTALPDAPLERVDLGSYVVTSFRLPQQRAAMPWAQRMLGESFTFGMDRILFPPEFHLADCQHGGYRLSRRPRNFMQPFDLGEAGMLGLAEAGIEDQDLIEVWNECLTGVYLSPDRGRLYLPGRGALLILERR